MASLADYDKFTYLAEASLEDLEREASSIIEVSREAYVHGDEVNVKRMEQSAAVISRAIAIRLWRPTERDKQEIEKLTTI